MSWTSACCFFCQALLYFLLSLSALPGQVLAPEHLASQTPALLWKAYIVCIFTKPDVWEQRNMRCCCPSALFKSHQSSTSEVSFFLFLELFTFLALHHSTLFHQGICCLLISSSSTSSICVPPAFWPFGSLRLKFLSPCFLTFPSRSNRWGEVLFRCWSFCPWWCHFMFQKDSDVAFFLGHWSPSADLSGEGTEGDQIA